MVMVPLYSNKALTMTETFIADLNFAFQLTRGFGQAQE